MKMKNIFKLSDGKKMCYAEYGDPKGKPIFLFHGNPGSRLVWGLIPDSPFLSKIRLICPDRPGYGFTDYKENVLEKWPNDIKELADSLKIKKFSIFAPSGGGPYALECAWKIPERLNNIGIFGSVGPNIPEATKGANKPLKLLWKISNPLFFLVKLQMKIMANSVKKNPNKVMEKLRNLELNEEEKKIFDKPKIRNIFLNDFPEAYRQDGIGSAYDSTIPATWNIPLDKIKKKIIVWHSKNDGLVGNMSKYIADKLPNSKLIIIKNSGHLWVLENMKKILKTLTIK